MSFIFFLISVEAENPENSNLSKMTKLSGFKEEEDFWTFGGKRPPNAVM